MAAGRLTTLFALGAGLALVAGSPALAGDPSPSAAAAAKPKADQSVRICREQTPTGSRFTRRICKTQQEWQRDEEFAQTRVDENRQSLRSPDMPGAGHPQ